MLRDDDFRDFEVMPWCVWMILFRGGDTRSRPAQRAASSGGRRSLSSIDPRKTLIYTNKGDPRSKVIQLFRQQMTTR